MKSELLFSLELLLVSKNICADSAQVFMKKTKIHNKESFTAYYKAINKAFQLHCSPNPYDEGTESLPK